MEAKRYFSKVPGAKFIFPDGVEIVFAFGRYDFKSDDFVGTYVGNSKEDPRNGKSKAQVYYEELEAVVKQKGGNPLFFEQNTQPEALDHITKEAARTARTEGEIAAANAAASQVRGRETGDINNGTIGGGGTDQSTVDNNLRKSVADFQSTNQTSAIQRARDAAAARTAEAQQQQNPS